MKKIVLPFALVAALAVWTGCKHTQAEGTEAKTFVLSDTMLASIRIDTTAIRPVESEGTEMPAIPSSAVIYDKGKNFVMVFRDKFNIDAREVKVARVVNETAYISQGLRPGEKIISRNQLRIYDALNN